MFCIYYNYIENIYDLLNKSACGDWFSVDLDPCSVIMKLNTIHK